MDKQYKAIGIDPKAVIQNTKELIRLINNDDRIYCILITWTASDVILKAHDMGITISSDQANLILQKCLKHHDCENGISWTTLEYWINEICGT